MNSTPKGVWPLALAALVLAACASSPGGAGGPPLKFSVRPGQELRFLRIFHSTSGNQEGIGLTLSSESEYRIDVCGVDPAGRVTLEVRLEHRRLDLTGLRGDLSFDTRRPETLEALGRTRHGRSALEALRQTRDVPRRYVVQSDGVWVEEGVEPGSYSEASGGSIPGLLPVGLPPGEAREGASLPFEAALSSGLAGVTYDDALPVQGTWMVTDWDPDSGLAVLELEGVAMFPKYELRTTRVESCELEGAAVWDTRLGLAVQTSWTAGVVLHGLEGSDIVIEWETRFEEVILR